MLLREDFIFYTNNNKYVWNNELFHYIFNLYKLFSFYVISQAFNFVDRLYRSIKFWMSKLKIYIQLYIEL